MMVRFAPLMAGAAAGVEQKLPVDTRVLEAGTLRPGKHWKHLGCFLICNRKFPSTF